MSCASSLCLAWPGLACRRTRASSSLPPSLRPPVLPPSPPSPAAEALPHPHTGLLGKWQDGSPACLRLIAAARQYNRASHDQQPGPPPPPPPGRPVRPNSGFAVRTYRLSLTSQIAFSLPHHHHLPFHLPFFGSPVAASRFSGSRSGGWGGGGGILERGRCVCVSVLIF